MEDNDPLKERDSGKKKSTIYDKFLKGMTPGK